MKFVKFALAGMVMGASMLLAACGSSDSTSAPPVAAANTVVPINSATGPSAVQAMLNKTFTFANGVPAFGTTSTTTLTLSGSGATPTFSIASGGLLASGTMTYGSCIFKVTSSPFTSGPLLLGSLFTVSPCDLTVATAGLPADGSSQNTTASLVLSGTTSSGVPVVVSISPTGVLTVNGVVIVSITVIVPTGAGS